MKGKCKNDTRQFIRVARGIFHVMKNIRTIGMALKHREKYLSSKRMTRTGEVIDETIRENLQLCQYAQSIFLFKRCTFRTFRKQF